MLEICQAEPALAAYRRGQRGFAIGRVALLAHEAGHHLANLAHAHKTAAPTLFRGAGRAEIDLAGLSIDNLLIVDGGHILATLLTHCHALFLLWQHHQLG